MTIDYIYFIYGLCVMFYGMMAWLFLRKNREILSRIVAVLMIVLSVQCIKDLFFIPPETTSDSALWMIMTSVDMIVIPLYAFILIELCRPATPPSLSIRKIALHELPFVLLPALFVITRDSMFYFANVAWAAAYGIGYAIWTVINIPRYHRLLKERFSYDDNINLNWLRYILLSFLAILLLWIVDCMIINLKVEAMYMLGALVVWMFICYFLYKHESVIDELSEPAIIAGTAIPDNGTSMLKERIFDLFENQRIYLNPQLRLSHVAAMAHTNRTYVSRFFNDSHGKTFFEFVNEYRVKYAISLLKTSNEKLDAIAEQSGFSSRQSFHRVFSKIAGCTPEQYRKTKTD